MLINRLKVELIEMKSEQSNQTAKVLAQQPLDMKAEDQHLCPGEPTRIRGQDKGISQLENATDKRREQSCMAIIEEVERLEAEEKVKGGGWVVRRQREGSYSLTLPSLFRTNMTLCRCQ